MTLAMLIGYAYRISPDRVAGPEWMRAPGSSRFEIVATIPQGNSKDQVPEMFQALLEERFSMAVHRRTASLPVYALVVTKGGLKIQRAAVGRPTEDRAADSEAADSLDGYYGAVQSRAIPDAGGNDPVTLLSNPRMGTVRQTGDPSRSLRWEAPDISFAGLADLLDHVAPVTLPVIDMTAVSGRYQLVLDVSLADLRAAGRPTADMETTILRAFNDGLRKLGLRMERRTGPVETIVVDRVERTPTAD